MEGGSESASATALDALVCALSSQDEEARSKSASELIDVLERTHCGLSEEQRAAVWRLAADSSAWSSGVYAHRILWLAGEPAEKVCESLIARVEAPEFVGGDPFREALWLLGDLPVEDPRLESLAVGALAFEVPPSIVEHSNYAGAGELIVSHGLATPQVLAALERAARSSGNRLLAVDALYILGRLGTRASAAAPWLLELWASTDCEVSCDAAEAYCLVEADLEKLSRQIGDWLRDWDRAPGLVVLKGMQARGLADGTLGALAAERLRDEDSNVRFTAFEMLLDAKAKEETVVEALRRYLGGAWDQERTLGTGGDDLAVTTRESLRYIIGSNGSAAALEPVCRRIAQDTEGDLLSRAMAVLACFRLGAGLEESLDRLLAILESAEPWAYGPIADSIHQLMTELAVPKGTERESGREVEEYAQRSFRAACGRHARAVKLLGESARRDNASAQKLLAILDGTKGQE